MLTVLRCSGPAAATHWYQNISFSGGVIQLPALPAIEALSEDRYLPLAVPFVCKFYAPRTFRQGFREHVGPFHERDAF
jgi:hypothetical protein